ncbi:MAG: NAD-dependent malic enzyme [Alphaproteobacteria bacterium]|nr:NAD-dependent malic enzyme [Alphaproteobacteria bacterium]
MTAEAPRGQAGIEVDLEGAALLTNPLLNKGTAFNDDERTTFALHGLLPPHVGTLDNQLTRRLQAVRKFDRDLDRYVFLRGLQDANETLFYALLTRNLGEMLPLVYTPTVGQGCQEFSNYWHYPRGLFLSWPHRDRIADILAHPRFDRIEAIVVSDGERILGLGDQGAGGMGIPIGKLSLYTACAGFHPATTLPILLDTGTDNRERLADPVYIGWRHERVRGADYDAFIEQFVTAVERRWPHVLLQWEDFARANAGRILECYRDRLCTFNDDIQGTAAVAAGTLLAATRVTGTVLRDQTFVLFGAGTAGCGIGHLLLKLMIDDGVPEAAARRRFFAVDRDGLLVEGMADLQPFQLPFVQPSPAVAGWSRSRPDRIDLLDVVKNARPTVLIGVSGQPGMFTEDVARTMASAVERPVIFPLSNPVSRSEATPADLLRWTNGRALIGTGSPFPPVEIDGKQFTVDQTNNAYIFPGVGLGVLAVKARRVSDDMFVAAAKALAGVSQALRNADANLLPPVHDLRSVAITVAAAVARQARTEGLCDAFDDSALEGLIAQKMWEPIYRPYYRKGRGS